MNKQCHTALVHTSNKQNTKALIINNLYPKRPATTGKIPAIFANTYQKYPLYK